MFGSKNSVVVVVILVVIAIIMVRILNGTNPKRGDIICIHYSQILVE